MKLFDPCKQLITVTMITTSGFHCTKKQPVQHSSQPPRSALTVNSRLMPCRRQGLVESGLDFDLWAPQQREGLFTRHVQLGLWCVCVCVFERGREKDWVSMSEDKRCLWKASCKLTRHFFDSLSKSHLTTHNSSNADGLAHSFPRLSQTHTYIYNSQAVNRSLFPPVHGIHKLLSDSFSHEFILTHIDARIPNEAKNKCCHPFHKSWWHKGKTAFTGRKITVWCLLVELLDCFLGCDACKFPWKSFWSTLDKTICLDWKSPHIQRSIDAAGADSRHTDTADVIVSQLRHNFTGYKKKNTLNPPHFEHYLPVPLSPWFFVSLSPFSHPMRKDLFCIKVSNSHESIVLVDADADTRGHTWADST